MKELMAIVSSVLNLLALIVCAIIILNSTDIDSVRWAAIIAAISLSSITSIALLSQDKQ
jgi:hypothetical protein